jgi:hypothetical protein
MMMKRMEASGRFDWLMSLLSTAFVGGLFLDGWAHTHGRVDATFFTPWHAVLYGAWGTCLLMLGGTLLGNVARGRAWREALPTGYGLSLAGAMLWFLAGPIDLLWHSLFGFEAGVEALLSPAHLLLALGLGLVATGPLRAALSRPPSTPVGWAGQLPMLLSVTSVFSVITFFMSLGHPLSNVPADAARFALMRAQSAGLIDLLQSAGVQGMLAWMAVLMATVFFLLGRGQAPAGSLTFLLTLNGAAMGLLYPRGAYPFAPVASFAVAGVVADGLRALLRPGADRFLAWRIFSFVVPAVTALAYFASLALTRGVWWSVHVWSGTVVLSGAVGWLLGYVALPPGRPALAAEGASRPSAVRSFAHSDVPVAINRGSSDASRTVLTP